MKKDNQNFQQNLKDEFDEKKQNIKNKLEKDEFFLEMEKRQKIMQLDMQRQ